LLLGSILLSPLPYFQILPSCCSIGSATPVLVFPLENRLLPNLLLLLPAFLEQIQDNFFLSFPFSPHAPAMAEQESVFLSSFPLPPNADGGNSLRTEITVTNHAPTAHRPPSLPRIFFFKKKSPLLFSPLQVDPTK
jgi:hypothetical protein